MLESSSNNDVNVTQNPKRPFGVWFLTIYMGLFAGIAPSGLALFLLLSQTSRVEVGITLGDFFLPIILGMVIVVTAFGTWKGNNQARIVFLVVVTIHYCLIMYQNYQIASLVSRGMLESDLGMMPWARIFRGAFWIVVCWAYFFSVREKLFYNLDSNNREIDANVCSKCGEDLKVGAAFCHECGTQP